MKFKKQNQKAVLRKPALTEAFNEIFLTTWRFPEKLENLTVVVAHSIKLKEIRA
jgi:hypothetical protein